MAPAHLQGALFNICMAPVHLQGAHTSPCARQFSIPTRGSVCPPTSKVAISSSSGVSKETWLSLISPLEMPDDARFASRSAQRRRSFPSTSNSKVSYLLFHPSITIHTTVVRLKFGRHDLAVFLRSGRRIFTSAAPSCSFIRSERSAAVCAFSRFFHDATPRMRGHKTPRAFNHLHADRRSTHITLKCARQYDHILHCRCIRRLIRGTLSPVPSLQCDVHWSAGFHVA